MAGSLAELRQQTVEALAQQAQETEAPQAAQTPEALQVEQAPQPAPEALQAASFDEVEWRKKLEIETKKTEEKYRKQFGERQSEYERRLEAIKQQEAEIESRRRHMQAFEHEQQMLRTSPVDYFKSKGLDADKLDIIARSMRSDKPEPELIASQLGAKYDSRLSEYEKKFEEQERKIAQATESLRQMQVRTMMDEIKQVADSDPDRFELARMRGASAYEKALTHIAQQYNLGRVLDYADALEEIEQGILEQEIGPVRGAKKLQKLLAEANGAPIAAPKKQSLPQGSTGVPQQQAAFKSAAEMRAAAIDQVVRRLG